MLPRSRILCLLTALAGLPGGGFLRAQQSLNLSDLSASFQTLSRRVGDSVVKVVSTGYQELDEDQSDEPGLTARQRTSGSGVVVRADGLIVTNAHVVQGAQRVRVTLPAQKGRVHAAEVVGLDIETDLALLRIPASGLSALPLADSDQVQQGQLVFAFGSPLGLDNSVSMGVVSSTARQLKADDPMAYIQTDAPINPGSSGGPLVDTEGRLIGINTLNLTQSGGSEGLGFAVPSNVVAVVMAQLLAHGRVSRGDIGAFVQTVTPLLAAGWQLPSESGALVTDVEEGSNAAKAGLAIGDVVVAANGKPVNNARQFQQSLFRPASGARLRLDVLRGARRLALAVEVARRPDAARLRAEGTRAENLVAELGIFGLDVNKELLEVYPHLRRDQGVLVVSLHADGPLLEEGFKVGDVLYAVNQRPVTGLAGLRALLRTLKPAQPVAVQIERDGVFRFVSFELP